jgi:dUTP pyrophosphatase
MQKEVTVVVQIKKLIEEAIIPTYAHDTDACADIYTVSNAHLSPGEILPFHTGLSVAIPEGWRIDIRPRSGLSCKNQLIIPNSPGTIDAGYRGELVVYLKNIGHDLIKIKEGDRIAQMKIEPVWKIDFEEVDSLPNSGRGGGGFGSTGS